jgi:hypothetical protein
MKILGFRDGCKDHVHVTTISEIVIPNRLLVFS